jgi:Transposase DDE domain
VPWTVFRDILSRAVALANDLWPRDDSYLWNKMPVYAFDGSKFCLPATAELRAEFDRKSGLENSGKGHYPQCLVMTAYDVFRQLPVARAVGTINSSERGLAQSLLSHIPPNSILLFDRGFPSYPFIKHLRENHGGCYIFRCAAQSTFPAVEEFIKRGKDEDFILLTPSSNFLHRTRVKERKKAPLIQLRVIRLQNPDGTLSVLLTNLLNQKAFPQKQIVDLYFRRWAIEGHYRNEKADLGIEQFHGKTSNSIRQELFAILIMTVIARTLMVLVSKGIKKDAGECQFKNAIMVLASEAAVLVPDNPEKAAAIFSEILDQISAVKYYRPKTPKPSQPRITKRAHNKWCNNRQRKLESP